MSETKDEIDEEIEILTKDGIRRRVLLTSSSVQNEEGKPIYSVSIQKDITEQWAVEKALRESE